MKKPLPIILFFQVMLFITTQAQHLSNNGKFTVSDVKGCAGMNIQVFYPGCGTTDFCAIQFGDGRTPSSAPFNDGDIIQYPTAGNFVMTIIYAATTVGNDDISISVTPNTPPAFEVYSCNGNNVSVKVTESNYPYYIINYNDATAEVTRPANSATDVHAYAPPPPATHTVSVRGYNGTFNTLPTQDNCISNDQVVDVYSTLPPTDITQVEVLDATQVKVDFNSISSIQYKMMIATNNASGFQLFKNVYNPAVNSETIPGITPDNNFYCFRMDTFNPCANTVVDSSPVVCSVNFDAVAQNNQNQLNWSTEPRSGINNFNDFTVRKEGIDLTPTLPFNQFAYTDPDIICNTDTAYQLVVNYPGNVKSISMAKTVTAFSTDIPTAIQNITASVMDGGAELSWQQDPAFTAKEYTITKAINGSFNLLGKTSTPAFLDEAYTTDQSACYQIVYTDVCLNESPTSLLSCPLRLDGSLNQDNTISLTWTDYVGWQSGVSMYSVEKYNSEGSLLETFSPGSSTTLLDNTEDFSNQVYTYVVFAHANEGGLPVALSNPITVVKESNLFYPTAFTPNNDGLNDTFNVFGQYIMAYEMKVFNRWGEMMYETDDLNGAGWNGTYKGNLMPEAAYVFKATITDLAGRTYDKSGSFLLLRSKK